MLLDLLRLFSLGQNMELYASLQIRQQATQPDVQPQQQQQTANQDHSVDPTSFVFGQKPQTSCNTDNKQAAASHSWSQRCPSGHQSDRSFSNSRQSDQAKDDAISHIDGPLDLTLKSCTDNKKRHGGSRRKSRPPPLSLKLCVTKARRKSATGSKHQQICRSQLRHKLIKLASSSISPSSTTASSSPASPLGPKDHNNNLNDNDNDTASQQLSQEAADNLISSSQAELSPAAAAAESTTPVNSANTTTTTTTTTKRPKLKGTKSHQCLKCGISFARSDMLTRHSRLHTGVKPYRCAKCKQEFSRSDHLSTHERTHTGEKPYQCQFCAYSACRRDMITRHMRTHSDTAHYLIYKC